MSQRRQTLYLPILIGGVRDGEMRVIEPDLTEVRIARTMGTKQVGDHVYEWRTFDLMSSDGSVRRSGITWPRIGAFVHEDLDLRAATMRVWEHIGVGTGMSIRN